MPSPELHIQLFWILCFGGWGYALLRGGGPERAAAWIFIIGILLSMLARPSYHLRFRAVDVPMLCVDTLMLVALGGLAFAARHSRNWPLWMTSLQIAVVLFHFPILLRPLVSPEGYAIADQFWPWLMMGLLIGATRAHRIRLRSNGTDACWSSSSDR